MSILEPYRALADVGPVLAVLYNVDSLPAARLIHIPHSCDGWLQSTARRRATCIPRGIDEQLEEELVNTLNQLMFCRRQVVAGIRLTAQTVSRVQERKGGHQS